MSFVSQCYNLNFLHSEKRFSHFSLFNDGINKFFIAPYHGSLQIIEYILNNQEKRLINKPQQY